MSAPDIQPTFEALLDYLRLLHGFDFTGYKRSFLIRRVQTRMQQIDITSYSDYVSYLQAHPEEFIPLFNTILINFTGFFRDASDWEYVASEIIPRIIAGKSESEPIRVVDKSRTSLAHKDRFQSGVQWTYSGSRFILGVSAAAAIVRVQVV